MGIGDLRIALGRLLGRPLVKASLTSGLVMAAGDVACQRLQSSWVARRDSDASGASAAVASADDSAIGWDRVQRFGIVGATLHGPWFFAAFRIIDRTYGPSTDIRTVIKKVATGQVCAFPGYLAAFLFYMGVLEGYSLETCVQKVKDSFVPVYASGSLFWPAVNVVNFSFVPPTQRILYVNVCGFLWNVYLSYANSQGVQRLERDSKDQ